MDFLHLKVTPKHRTATAKSPMGAAAYRAAENLVDKINGDRANFARKGGVTETLLLLPPQAPADLLTVQGLWDSVQASAPSKGRVTWAQEIEIGLPNELDHDAHKQILKDFIDKYIAMGFCAQASFHNKGDGNPHVHILLTARKLDAKGQWLPQEKRKRVYANCRDENGRPAFDPDLPTTPDTRIPVLDKEGKQKYQYRLGCAPQPRWEQVVVVKPDFDLFSKETLLAWRAEAAGCINRAYQEHGLDIRVDHRSFKERGIDRTPTRHLGSYCKSLERRGVRTRRGDWNRMVRRLNSLQAAREARDQALAESAKRKAEQQAMRQEIAEQFADIRFADSLFMAICHDPYLRKLWLELDRIERQYALKKLAESRSEGVSKPTIKPMATRLVAALFDAIVVPEINEKNAKKAAEEAAEEAAQRQREAQRRAADEAAKKTAMEEAKHQSEERRKRAEEAKREAEERRKRVEAQHKAEEVKAKPETREEQLARLIGKPIVVVTPPAQKIDNAIKRMLSQPETKPVTKPITRQSQVSEHSATKPADDLGNAISKILSPEHKPKATTASSVGLDAIEKSLDELFAKEEEQRQKEREEAWARMERGEAEPEPEMTEEEREIARLAAMYGNDNDDESERENAHVHGAEVDQSQRRRGRGR